MRGLISIFLSVFCLESGASSFLNTKAQSALNELVELDAQALWFESIHLIPQINFFKFEAFEREILSDLAIGLEADKKIGNKWSAHIALQYIILKQTQNNKLTKNSGYITEVSFAKNVEPSFNPIELRVGVQTSPVLYRLENDHLKLKLVERLFLQTGLQKEVLSIANNSFKARLGWRIYGPRSDSQLSHELQGTIIASVAKFDFGISYSHQSLNYKEEGQTIQRLSISLRSSLNKWF